MTGVNTGYSILFFLNLKHFWYMYALHPDTSWYKSCFLVDFNGVCRGYIQNVGILDNSSSYWHSCQMTLENGVWSIKYLLITVITVPTDGLAALDATWYTCMVVTKFKSYTCTRGANTPKKYRFSSFISTNNNDDNKCYSGFDLCINHYCIETFYNFPTSYMPKHIKRV